MTNFKTGWMKKLIDGVSEKIFAIAHVKTVYYDYANKKTLSDKLDDMDTTVDEIKNSMVKSDMDMTLSVDSDGILNITYDDGVSE